MELRHVLGSTYVAVAATALLLLLLVVCSWPAL